MEGILRASAVRSGIGERLDDLHLLDDRAWPSVRHDQRQRVLVLRSNMNEMDVEPVDGRHEMGERSEFRLTLAPVVIRCPVTGEVLHHLQPHTL